jgi:outer membrane protein OmpA-like peptidoglycan-associated protein
MRALLHILLPAFMLLSGTALKAQGIADALIREGDKHYDDLAYARAIDAYKAAADMGAMNDHVTKRLAESHMRVGNMVEAERWYSVVVKFLNREPADLYNYAMALKSNGRYAEAEEWMDLYLTTVNPEGAGRSNISGFAKKFVQDQDRFRVRPVSINSEYSDFGTAWYGQGQVIFTSARNRTTGIERRAAFDDQPFLDLYVADVTPDGDLRDPRRLPGAVNTRFHEGPATASRDGQVIWFTRNNYYRGRASKSEQGISRLGLFKAHSQNGKWTGVEQFLYNNSEISIGHPALSPDGKSLYFVSDMPGGHGGTDIYVCHDNGGQWGEPRNLGPTVNTPYNEVFPFIGSDGTLYFSSDGHPGLGGLDVFAAASTPKGGFRPAVNVGAPVNSTRDDFAFIIDAGNSRGFFSSNRSGGMGHDDIYAFDMLAPLEERYMVTGVVFDEEDDIPVFAVDVEMFDMNGRSVAATQTDQRGEYAFPVEKDAEYRIVARMKGRVEAVKHLSTDNIEQMQIATRDLILSRDGGVWLRGVARIRNGLGFIDGMNVTLVNLSSFHTESQRTAESGDFQFRIQGNEDFEIHFEKEGWFSQSIPLSTMGMRDGIIDLNEVRDLSFEKIEPGMTIPLRHVRWGEGRPVLEPVAKTELDLVAERLLVNPTIQIEIGVHSDARGNAAEKQRLTQKQADVIMEYLRGKGVPKERMTARGHGSSQLLNHCQPGVECSAAEHEANRRSEYKVTGTGQ